MGMNAVYAGPRDLPQTIPVFPVAGALLLPRGQMPLNIFEPRYLAMVENAICGHRIIGMVQPDVADDAENTINTTPKLFNVGCAGRVTQFAETGDGRLIISLTGIARFRILEEVTTITPWREAKVDFAAFENDFTARAGEDEVDRAAVVDALERFVKANKLDVDWKGVEDAPNEALVNALSMMSPYGVKEKQALLEARTLKDRAEALVAITEYELARRSGGGDNSSLQ